MDHFGQDIDDLEHTHHRSIKGFFNGILPEEFEEGKWFDLFVHSLLLEHSWICIFAPYKKGRDRRATKFAISMCNLIAFLFTTTVLAVLFFRDDGQCEGRVPGDMAQATNAHCAITTENGFIIRDAFDRLLHYLGVRCRYPGCAPEDEHGIYAEQNSQAIQKGEVAAEGDKRHPKGR